MNKKQPVEKYLAQSRFTKTEILLICCIALSTLLTLYNVWLCPILVAFIAGYVFLRAPRVSDDDFEHMLYQLFYNNPIKYRFEEEYEAILLFIFHPKVEQRKVGDYTVAGYDLCSEHIVRGSDNVWRSNEYHVFNLHFLEKECRIYTLTANLLDWTVSEHTYTVPYNCRPSTETRTVTWHGEQKTLYFLCFGNEVALPVDPRSMDYPEVLKHFSA